MSKETSTVKKCQTDRLSFSTLAHAKKTELTPIEFNDNYGLFAYLIMPLLFFIFMSITTIGLIIFVCRLFR